MRRAANVKYLERRDQVGESGEHGFAQAGRRGSRGAEPGGSRISPLEKMPGQPAMKSLAAALPSSRCPPAVQPTKGHQRQSLPRLQARDWGGIEGQARRDRGSQRCFSCPILLCVHGRSYPPRASMDTPAGRPNHRRSFGSSPQPWAARLLLPGSSHRG